MNQNEDIGAFIVYMKSSSKNAPQFGTFKQAQRVQQTEALIGKVITVSVETVRLVNEPEQKVKMEDRIDEMVLECQ